MPYIEVFDVFVLNTHGHILNTHGHMFIITWAAHASQQQRPNLIWWQCCEGQDNKFAKARELPTFLQILPIQMSLMQTLTSAEPVSKTVNTTIYTNLYINFFLNFTSAWAMTLIYEAISQLQVHKLAQVWPVHVAFCPPAVDQKRWRKRLHAALCGLASHRRE